MAKGSQRYVFIHPDDPGLIIKVIRPDAIDRAWNRWYKFRRSYGQYLSYMREIGEHVAAHAREGASPPFVQQVRGLVDTDLGLGLVLEAVRGEDGSLAPPLKSLLRQGAFDKEAERALEDFIVKLMDSDVIASDIHSGNLVYAYDRVQGHRFVMIDGIGQPNIIPLKRFSRTFNRKGKARRIEKLRGQIARARASSSSRGRPTSQRIPWFRPVFATAAVAAALTLLGPVLRFADSDPTPGETASSSDVDFFPSFGQGDALSAMFGFGDTDTPRPAKATNPPDDALLQAWMPSSEESHMRLAPWLHFVRDFDDEDPSVLTNPYSANDGEDDMSTSLPENVPLIQ